MLYTASTMPLFLISSIVLFFIWLAFFLFSNQTRREQIIMSIVGLILAPGVLIVVSNDYRNAYFDQAAGVGLEDFIFSFALFGIAAVIYQIFIGKHTHKLRGDRWTHPHPVVHWITHLLLVLGLWTFISLLLMYVFELASIRSLIVGGLMVGIYIIADRKDLIFDALLSGLFTMMLVFLTEQIFFIRLFPVAAKAFWRMDQITLFTIGGVPLEELLWAAVIGFTVGPMYEWLRRYQLK